MVLYNLKKILKMNNDLHIMQLYIIRSLYDHVGQDYYNYAK